MLRPITFEWNLIQYKSIPICANILILTHRRIVFDRIFNYAITYSQITIENIYAFPQRDVCLWWQQQKKRVNSSHFWRKQNQKKKNKYSRRNLLHSLRAINNEKILCNHKKHLERIVRIYCYWKSFRQWWDHHTDQNSWIRRNSLAKNRNVFLFLCSFKKKNQRFFWL